MRNSPIWIVLGLVLVGWLTLQVVTANQASHADSPAGPQLPGYRVPTQFDPCRPIPQWNCYPTPEPIIPKR